MLKRTELKLDFTVSFNVSKLQKDLQAWNKIKSSYLNHERKSGDVQKFF